MDALAAGGLRFNRFHTTALCSPTRACLLTGRNHHSVGMGFLTDIPMGFPGYSGRIPSSAAALPRLLRDAGYSTMAVGKWHLCQMEHACAAGPYEHWPCQRGFDRYYGVLDAFTNLHHPHRLTEDNHAVEIDQYPEGYYLTDDIDGDFGPVTDRAVRPEPRTPVPITTP